jgi:hypothetical protein
MKFSKPATPSGLKLDDLHGSLLVINPLRVETGVTTSFGSKDAVVADVHVIDGDHAGDVFRNTMIWPAVLQGQLRSSIGGNPVLGRLGKGSVIKSGQSAPWVLADATEQDEELATAYLGDGATVGAVELSETPSASGEGDAADSSQPPF